MRTRCPACATVFRVTTEQLRLRAGKVRCGQCQAVFNAFDQLVSDDNEPLIVAPPAEDSAPPEETQSPQVEAPCEDQGFEPEALVADAVDDLPLEIAEPVPGKAPEEVEHLVDIVPAEVSPVAVEPSELPLETETVLIQAPLEEPLCESPEESTQAARQAGLVAARELGETTSFNRWSAGTLVGEGLGGFEGDSNRRVVWPFVVMAIFLMVGLVSQLLYYFRTDIVLRFPGLAELYALAAVDIPLPRNAALVSIETSDLQSENTRGQFVLQATLKNRAAYAQAWPALELSLTDTNDSVVSRRVMFAADYLPPGTTTDAFPANGDLAVKLSIEARNIGASGYRLYIFYP